MLTSVLTSVLAAGLATPASVAAQSHADPDHRRLAQLELVLGDEVESSALRGTTAHPGPAGPYWTSRDGRTLYERDGEDVLWRVTLVGPGLPPDARLMLVTGLATVRSALLPDTGYGLWLPGRRSVLVFDETHPGQTLPAEAPSGGRVVTGGAEDFARALHACPGSRRPCALVGEAHAVAAARDPLAPGQDRRLESLPSPEVPLGSPSSRSTHPTAIPGARIVVERRVVERTVVERAVPSQPPVAIERVFLELGGRTQHAFDREVIASADPGRLPFVAAVIGERIYVHDRNGRVSTHDRSTGTRLGEPSMVRLSPLYDVGPAGDNGYWIVPLLSATQADFVLVTYDGDIFVLNGTQERREPNVGPALDRLHDLLHFERRGRTLIVPVYAPSPERPNQR